MSDVLADPQVRREIWHDIAAMCLRWALRRPWKSLRWRAVLEALRYSEMTDPPRIWPNGNPMEMEARRDDA